LDEGRFMRLFVDFCEFLFISLEAGVEVSHKIKRTVGDGLTMATNAKLGSTPLVRAPRPMMEVSRRELF